MVKVENEEELFILIDKLGDGIKNFKDYKVLLGDGKLKSMGMIFGADVIKDLKNVINESNTYPEIVDTLRKKYKLTQFQCGVLLGHFMTIQSIRGGMNVI